MARDSPDSNDVSTPQWLFDACQELAVQACGSEFALDAAAAKWNAKCRRFWTREDDALSRDWAEFPAVFCNPPWSKPRLGNWVRKALEASRRGTTVVLVLPQWNYPWYDLCEQFGRIHRIIGPLAFRRRDGSTLTMNNDWRRTATVVVMFGPAVVPGRAGGPIRKGEIPMSEQKLEALSEKEQARLVELEQVVMAGWDAYLKAGAALAEIKADRLYRATHATFEDYVKDRFARTRQWAYNLIHWYEFNVLAGTTDDPLPVNATNVLKGVKDEKTAKKVVSAAKRQAKKEGREEPTVEDFRSAKLRIVPPNQPQQRPPNKPETYFRLAIFTAHRTEVLKVLEAVKPKDDVTIVNRGTGSKPIEVEVPTLGSLLLHIGKALDKLPSGSDVDVAMKGEKKVRQRPTRRRRSA